MKTFAFKSKVENNKIDVPDSMFAEMQNLNNKEIRVIVLMEELEEFDDAAFKEFTKIFFKKYASNLETIKNMIKNSND